MSFWILSIAPLLILPLAAERSLRVPGIYQGIGALLFALVASAVWLLGWTREEGAAADRGIATAGSLLVAPFALIALLWVGLATPWDATPPENVMRYAVLLAASIAVTGGFIVLGEMLRDSGLRVVPTLGMSANILAGSGYLVWISFQLGTHASRAAQGFVSDSLVALGNVFDTLLFVVCALTYLTAALFAHALGRARWLGLTASRIFVTLNLILLLFLTLRGLSFPDPTKSVTPWYLRPGFIAGIPAIPWLIPYFLGVVVLRRAVTERS